MVMTVILTTHKATWTLWKHTSVWYNDAYRNITDPIRPESSSHFSVQICSIRQNTDEDINMQIESFLVRHNQKYHNPLSAVTTGKLLDASCNRNWTLTHGARFFCVSYFWIAAYTFFPFTGADDWFCLCSLEGAIGHVYTTPAGPRVLK